MPLQNAYFESKMGTIKVEASEKGLKSLQFVENRPANEVIPSSPILNACLKQLAEYFDGKRKSFDLPLDFSGATPFMQEVWRELDKIPFGQTKTYAQIAEKLGKPKAARAVGTANGKNRIAIIVPCHRLVGTNGNLRGFAYGIWRKKALLELEGADWSKNKKPTSERTKMGFE